MKNAMKRVVQTGELDAPTAKPMISKEIETADVAEGYNPSLIDFLIPIGTLIGFSIIPWILTGSPMIFEAFGLSVIAGMITSKIRGMSLEDLFDGLVDGIRQWFSAIIFYRLNIETTIERLVNVCFGEVTCCISNIYTVSIT